MFDFSELKDGTVHEKMYLMYRNKKNTLCLIHYNF